MEDFSKIIKKDNKDLLLNIIQNPSHLPQHPFRMLINGSSGSGKTNLLLNLLFNKDYSLNFHKIYLYAKDLEEDKYQWLIKKMETAKTVNNGDVFDKGTKIEEVVKCDDLNKEKMNLIIFDDFVTEKDQQKIEDLFIRSRKKNASIIYLSQVYHAVPSMIRKNLNYVVFFKPSTKRETSTLSVDYATDIDKDEFFKIVNEATRKPYSFLVIDMITQYKPMRYRCGFTGLSCWDNE